MHTCQYVKHSDQFLQMLPPKCFLAFLCKQNIHWTFRFQIFMNRGNCKMNNNKRGDWGKASPPRHWKTGVLKILYDTVVNNFRTLSDVATFHVEWLHCNLQLFRSDWPAQDSFILIQLSITVLYVNSIGSIAQNK